MLKNKKSETADIDTSKMRDIVAYTHGNVKRANIPLAGMAHYDKTPETAKTYAFDPHLDPTLQWAGKEEGLSFSVPTSSIHVHESIKPHKIIRSVQAIGDDYQEQQTNLFETPTERMRKRQDAIESYLHSVDWKNRMIAGESLVVMNSLIKKEGMAGMVQMVYIDPPYGIKYGSNFQPFVNDKVVKDNDGDLSQEPETIAAFRDTWELGIHSYLSYLRKRLLLARELLSDSGSVFVQIGAENTHYIRILLDEIFGCNNFISQISFITGRALGTTHVPSVCNYLLWYAKEKKTIKFNRLFIEKKEGEGAYTSIMLPDGTWRTISKAEAENQTLLPQGTKFFFNLSLLSAGRTESCVFPVHFENKQYFPSGNRSWKTNESGMKNLIKANRIISTENALRYVLFHEDYPVKELTSMWGDTSPENTKIYVVQTSTKVIQRCLLMTTDPGDLVLDITCGSGTTAYVAEQWGRRWITCDTSRVAITLAKKRLMTATYDYYKLAHEEQGVSSGFVYKTVPHITLKSIANDEPPAKEFLYDQPEIDRKKIRVSSPFTVEALPAPVVRPLDEAAILGEDLGVKQAEWREELLAAGIIGQGGAKIEFSRVEPLPGTRYLQAEAETKESVPRRAVVCFAGETKPLDSRMVYIALDEAEKQRPKPKLIVFAAFQFDPEAASLIEETNWPEIQLLKVQMNTDLMTEDLKKKRSSNQSFWLIGQPDVELIKLEDAGGKGKYKVRVKGYDYYNVKTGKVESGDNTRIAMWMLDTDYDGLCVEPMQVFFPMDGKGDGWGNLAKTLRAEINQDLIEQYAGNESLPFAAEKDTKLAVKIVDDRGIESLKIITIGGD